MDLNRLPDTRLLFHLTIFIELVIAVMSFYFTEISYPYWWADFTANSYSGWWAYTFAGVSMILLMTYKLSKASSKEEFLEGLVVIPPGVLLILALWLKVCLLVLWLKVYPYLNGHLVGFYLVSSMFLLFVFIILLRSNLSPLKTMASALLKDLSIKCLFLYHLSWVLVSWVLFYKYYFIPVTYSMTMQFFIYYAAELITSK
ncbi:hypothetical protein [Thermococcus sp. P6]|uniref:hypothetical protein n=1 Tax=Thermococcus sp. P6 TaxID=122420 RepID=UPI0012FE18AB|nr:hypothetical protein [Thermococcus sp. P6]